MRALLFAACVLIACDGDDDDTPDSGVTDIGFLEDGCSLDNPAPDSGIALPPCNPSNGTGCVVSSGRYCVWNFVEDEGSCRCLGDAPKALDEICSPFTQDCAPGLACLPIGENATCYQVCARANPTSCDRLSNESSLSLCVPLGRSDGTITRNYGVCLGFPKCNPLADSCPADETCVYAGRTANVCLPSGSVPIGGDCSIDECAKGGVCVELVDANGTPLGTNCYEPCDLSRPACGGGTCTDVGITGYGLCI